MAAFQYKALNAQGAAVKGVIEGDHARQVRQLLRERGLTPLELNEVREQAQTQGQTRLFQRHYIKPAELALLTRQLATLSKSGAPIEEALATAARQQERQGLKSVILAVRAKVLEGYTLAEGLAEFPKLFPDLFRATIAAGEESGHLDPVLERLADYTEAREVLQQKINSAMFYPMMLVIVAVLVLAGLLGYVVPNVVSVFDTLDQELPKLTQYVLAASAFVENYALFLGVGIVALSMLVSRLLKIPSLKRSYHAFQLKLPLVGKLVRGVNTARFARTLAMLAASGVPILRALQIAAEVMPNMPMREAVEEAIDKVREGGSIHGALEQSRQFPPMTLYLLASGELSGNLEEMLERAAEQQERETDGIVSSTLTLFEPLLVVVLGGVVLVIVLAILLPIFELNQLVG